MKKTILQIYALLICFVTLLCFAITLGKGIYDVFRITNPTLTLNSYQYQRLQSNESFCQSNKEYCTSKNDAKITESRELEYKNYIISERRAGIQGVLISLIILIIDIVIFIPHWILARRQKE